MEWRKIQLYNQNKFFNSYNNEMVVIYQENQTQMSPRCQVGNEN